MEPASGYLSTSRGAASAIPVAVFLFPFFFLFFVAAFRWCTLARVWVYCDRFAQDREPTRRQPESNAKPSHSLRGHCFKTVLKPQTQLLVNKRGLCSKCTRQGRCRCDVTRCCCGNVLAFIISPKSTKGTTDGTIEVTVTVT